MNDMDDKLIQMLRASGAEQCNSAGTLFMVSVKDAAAYRSAILADAAKDAESVAWRVNFIDPSRVMPNGTAWKQFDAGSPECAAYIVGLTSTLAAAQALNAELVARKDSAYEERNKVVAALARLFPSGVARTAIEGWSEDWHGCVYIDLPTGQVSWHFHDSQAHLFEGLPAYAGSWDGHDTLEKYRRLAAIAARSGT